MLAFALGLVFLTALMAGLLPAISSTGAGIFAGLQESSRSIGGSLSRAMLRKTLLTVEIALTVILLVSAGLAVQELSAPAHGQFGLRHRSRTHHGVRLTRQAI